MTPTTRARKLCNVGFEKHGSSRNSRPSSEPGTCKGSGGDFHEGFEHHVDSREPPMPFVSSTHRRPAQNSLKSSGNVESRDARIGRYKDGPADAGSDRRKDGRGAFVIVLVNRKGGVTKTTSAANLGAMISHAYRRLTRLLLEEVRRRACQLPGRARRSRPLARIGLQRWRAAGDGPLSWRWRSGRVSCTQSRRPAPCRRRSAWLGAVPLCAG